MKRFLSAVLAVAMVIPMLAMPAAATDNSGFDENNIILRFGVVSDTHQSAFYEQAAQGWAHTIDTLQRMAGVNDDGSTKLDAILVNGDLVDGIANNSSNVRSFATEGTKAEQNFEEVSNFAKGIWGTASNYNTIGGGNGNGIEDGVKLFYSLGNHDEDGRGYTKSSTKTIDGEKIVTTPVYSADYFAAVNCGWQYNSQSEEALANAWGGTGEYNDGFESSYISFIADLIDYNTNSNTTVTADSFKAAYGVELSEADAKFDKFYGHLDNATTLTDTDDGLRLGNAHMTIDPNPDNDDNTDRIHFIAIELSQSADSVAWAKEILDASVAEDPTKPIFVITHYKMPNTMGSLSSTSRLHDVIKNYPQVVIWGGHSHTTMHNDTAINSDNGYVAVESASTRYLSTTNILTQEAAFGAGTSANASYPEMAYNYPYKEANHFGNACYVEVDNDFNVRINRVDLFRSYSKDYENSEFYNTNVYTNFSTVSENDAFTAVDTPVLIRQPWDIVGIDQAGSHLSALSTTGRTEAATGPTFPDDDTSLSTSQDAGVITAHIKLNAEDDGMVHMYVVELYDGETLVDRKYYTNFYYEFPQNSDTTLSGNSIDTALEYDVTFDGLNPATEYTVKYYAADEFGVKGEELTSTQTTDEVVKIEHIIDISKAGNINSVTPDTNVEPSANWAIASAGNGTAAFFQYDLSDITDGEIVVSAEWRGFVIEAKDKNVKFVQYKTDTLLDPATATYNSITQSPDYLATATDIYSDTRVSTANGNYDTATAIDASGASVEQARLKIDMTEALKTAVEQGNKYFTFIGIGTAYDWIQFPRYAYKPSPQLIITTIKPSQITLRNPANGTLYKQENTAFDISADVTPGSAAISSVAMTLTDSDGEVVECSEPTVSENSYNWNFANGLSADTYTAVITVTDALGYENKTTVIIKTEGNTTVTKGMNFSYSYYQNATTCQIRKDKDTILQYDISDIPSDAIVTSANWYFGYSADHYETYLKDRPGNLKFTKLTNTSKLNGEPFTPYWGDGAVAAPTGMDLASSAFLTTDKTIGELANTIAITKSAQNGSNTISDVSGHFVQVDMTDYVKAAVDAGEEYFGFDVKNTDGTTPLLTFSKYNSGFYRPMLEVTYLAPLEDHVLTIADGTATASVTVDNREAVLIVAAYDSNGCLVECVSSDTVVDGKLTASITQKGEGITFKSFIWNNFTDMIPLSQSIEK